MKTIKDYNNAFIEVFGIEATALNADFSKDTVEEWDSVHQLNIIAQLEETFDIMLDPEDIMEFTSYEKGKAIMNKYEVAL
jgi:acyl carrier protein